MVLALGKLEQQNTRHLEGPVRFRLSPRLAVLPVLAVALFLPTVHDTRLDAASESVRDMSPATAESAGMSADRLRRIDAKMKQMVDDNRLAGVVTLLTRHGKIVDVTVHGKKDIRTADPIQRDSIFRIASMTKPITGVAMMMLYEEGKWRLDDPVSRYIPEFAKLKVYAGDNADGSMKLEDARRSMTMRELMTHTAGFGYTINQNNPVDRLYRQTVVLDTSKPLQNLVDNLGKLPLLSQPGTRWYYSIAVDVQGYLIEKFSGQSFADFARTRIFEPLGMKDTAFYVPAEKVSRLALIHSEDATTGKLNPPENGRDPTIVPRGPSGGGGLFSTADDYARFCEMLLEGGQFKGTRLLAPRTVEMMRTNHVMPEPLKTMAPGTGWGLDFNVVMDAAMAGESTPTGTFHWFGINGTWFWIDPVNDLAFVGMIQHSGRAAAEVRGVSRNLVYQALER
jgi:CubicO group peptidase (beta-lactamase class C family)